MSQQLLVAAHPPVCSEPVSFSLHSLRSRVRIWGRGGWAQHLRIFFAAKFWVLRPLVGGMPLVWPFVVEILSRGAGAWFSGGRGCSLTKKLQPPPGFELQTSPFAATPLTHPPQVTPFKLLSQFHLPPLSTLPGCGLWEAKGLTLAAGGCTCPQMAREGAWMSQGRGVALKGGAKDQECSNGLGMQCMGEGRGLSLRYWLEKGAQEEGRLSRSKVRGSQAFLETVSRCACCTNCLN